MEMKDFLRTVWGDTGEGFLCIFGNRLTDGKRSQKFYQTVEMAAKAAEKLSADGYDAYFAPARFTESGSRKADNVATQKSLYIDIDCGEGKPYDTQQQALDALKNFCRQAMPKPSLIVNSGGGLHAYWVLDTPIGLVEWKALAVRLSIACEDFGLHVDPTVTADAARVLRMPGTWNCKESIHRPVTVLMEGPLTSVDAIDATLPTSAPVLPPNVLVPGLDTVTNTLAGAKDKWFDKIIAKSKADKGCAHIKRALEEPNSLSYGQWLDVLSIAKFCDDSADAIHRISKGYDKYDPEETERVADSLSAPHLCSTFDANAPGVCDDCPHRQNGNFTTPIILGIAVREAPPDEEVEAVPADAPAKRVVYRIPAYPKPFFRGATGGVFVRKTDKDGDPVELRVYRDDLYLVRRLYDPLHGPVFVFRVHTPRDGVVDFTVAGHRLITRDKFREELAMHGIIVYNPEDLMAYIHSWINELQQKTDQTTAKTQFGWTSADAKSFVVGNKEYYTDHIDDNPPSAATLQYFPAFTPKGTLEDWVANIDFLNRPGCEPQQYMVGLAFGAPLMAFTSVPGAIFHMHSPESGHGKTTAMMAGASVWGNPQALIMKAKDTTNSQWARAEVMKNLPLWIDELSNIAPKDASDMVYSVTDANQKNRMRSSSENLERVRGAPWQLLIGTTGNASLLEKIKTYKQMPDGEAQRILEYRARAVFTTTAEKAGTDLFARRLTEHYGHAGPIYIQKVMAKLDKAIALQQQIQAYIDNAANLTASNRIWSAQVSCVLAGLTIARSCGLVSFDVKALTDWAVLQLKDSKGLVKDSKVSAMDVLTQYYADQFQSILRIRGSDMTPPPVAETGLDTLIVPDSTPKNHWTMRHEFDTNRLFMMVKPLQDWCTKYHINYSWLKEEMERSPLNGRKDRIRMGRGTRFNTPPMTVHVVDWDSTMDDIVNTRLYGAGQPEPESETD